MAVDLLTLLGETYPALGAASSSDLVFWTTGALARFAYDAGDGLSRRVPFMASRTTVAVVAGTASYALPARHVGTFHLSVDGYSLRPASVEELDALDDDWRTYADYPERYIEGLGGSKTVRLHPNPIVNATGHIAYYEHPDDDSTTLAVPDALKEYYRLAIIGGARGSEGKGAMPEVAAWCGRVMGLIEQVAAGYWGAG